MPPRLNKRQLREQEELAALSTSKEAEPEVEEESEDEQPTAWSRPAQQSAFAALGPEDHEDTESDASGPSQAKQAGSSTSTSKKKKKKKKKAPASAAALATPEATSTPEPAPSPSPASQPPTQKSSKQKKSKAKQKPQEEGDEIDRALAELALKHPGSVATPASKAPSRASSAFFSLLSVSLSNLDSEAEMRKFFGSKVVAASKAASSSSSPSRRRPVTARSNLTNPQSSWWPADLRQGLSLRQLTDEELAQKRSRHGYEEADVQGEKYWTVEYGKKYKGVTKSFIHMVMSGDPDGFFQLLRAFPYHADTLLQLSEVYSHREEHSSAADFIDRALFTYERAFIGAFNFTMGVNRLDFDHVENRPFYLGVHRQVADLQRRGCVRTSFEFAKLLLSLDPSSDPHGSLFHLDFLAIKSGQAQWLLDMWNAFEDMSKSVGTKRFTVTALPGWAYGRALALYTVEKSKHDIEHEKSTAALAEAIRKFPSIVPLLADKADITLPSDIRSSPAFRIKADAKTTSSEAEAILHLLSHLYAQRSNPLWKPKDVSKWFADTVASTVTASPTFARFSPSPPTDFRTLFALSPLAFSVYRHVLVQETSYRNLFAFFPPSVIAARQLACDPLPPPTRVTEYDSAFFAGAEDPFAHTARSRKQNARLLEQLIPDAAFRRQLEGFFQANPQFAQRFPGGIVQFAQLAGQLPEDALEDLFAAELAAEPPEEVRPGGMRVPGGLFGDGLDDLDDVDDVPPLAGEVRSEEEDGEESTEEDEGEGDEAVAPLPVRIWRNVLGRFWGGGEIPAEEEEETD
ncbi:hypothetical protein EIP91_008499 [Steccherinum ochraceum]|uniref:Transcription factor 25 n=1 Tax=Steccherinum ochraceum TaxID=92696 RepID=A0A4R0RPV8_9APHY|nr:hypothetical protein EIP91_008499 [Steccherinum ochraceum]